MFPVVLNMSMPFADALVVAFPLLAQTSGPSASMSWAIVLFLTIMGLLVTLSPTRRTYEVKKRKDE